MTDDAKILIDAMMLRMAELVSKIAARIENGELPDTGTVPTLKALARSIVDSTEELTR